MPFNRSHLNDAFAESLKGKPHHKPIRTHEATEYRILVFIHIEKHTQNGRFHTESPSWANVAIA